MRKYFIASLLVFAICFVTKAQTKPDSSKKETEVFLPVDVSAEFPGELEKFAQYIFKNLKYPEKAKEEKTQGKVFVSFVVEKDGSLTDIKIFKSVSPELDAEAIRLMKASPKWKPGMQGNNPVRQNYTLPIPFTLDN
ncbi:energy transducer TonB [Mucilaginibacter mali]|uniref:Energy transducer TonB n=1 Tax=Mucilaginibacter mali TaxID=2740462 RepID=A0A7D4Q6A4_9SPHI|nr:energy transducer TonB [Mucilaginibacter mali]QKJ29051.1 energy transducer TonB [Mucilaginibacter mali]